MLAQLGPVIFEIQPLNLTEISRETSASFVEKPVMGRRPPLEFVGDSTETIKLTVKLFPERFGGLSFVRDLDAMRMSGIAQYFMRGDGTPQGWFVIESVSEKATYLGGNGVGKVYDVDLTLKRSDPPSASNYFASIAGMV
jgi:phage protein U